jgi:ubiquinone biosynthesis monooxygenase Coq6
MATVDKLNKLYSLEIPPVVWARSVGVEVLNELPSLKAAMMGSAGGSSEGAPQTGPWSTLANAYEAAQKARVLAQGIGSLAAGAIVSTIHRATAPKL